MKVGLANVAHSLCRVGPQPWLLKEANLSDSLVCANATLLVCYCAAQMGYLENCNCTKRRDIFFMTNCLSGNINAKVDE